MRLGPVFQAELFTLSRRPRFFVGRALYGLIVLLIVTTTYQNLVSMYSNSQELSPNVMASFGSAIFTAFAWLQGIIVLLMTPVLVAGAIADEKQRKTLHYLMASQLSSTEIVLGKVGARLLRVAVIGAIGLPVLSLIGLFGGVDFNLVFLVYGATASTTFFLASMAIFCSVHAVKPRDAIVKAYFVEFLWLTVPTFMLSTMRWWSPFWQAIGESCQPALVWVAACSPTDLLRQFSMNTVNALRSVYWMIGLQVAYGVLLIILAAARLRPVFRNEGGPGWWVRLFGRKQTRPRWRLWPRPACRDDAMLWKEMHLHRIGTSKRIALILLGFCTIGVTIYTGWETITGAVGEAFQGQDTGGSHQRDLAIFLRIMNGVLLVVILVGLASVSASSVSSEREGDTWINLTSAPLDGIEIVRGKILGSIWMFRSLISLLLGCWMFGMLVGAIHPLGVLACVLELAVFVWFVATLGVTISLRSRNTIQALVLTVGILIFMNVGYLFLLVLFQSNSAFMMFGCMPFHFVVSLVTPDELYGHWPERNSEILLTILVGTSMYALGALYLTYRSIGNFDKVVDRPSRNQYRPTANLVPPIPPAVPGP